MGSNKVRLPQKVVPKLNHWTLEIVANKRGGVFLMTPATPPVMKPATPTKDGQNLSYGRTKKDHLAREKRICKEKEIKDEPIAGTI